MSKYYSYGSPLNYLDRVSFDHSTKNMPIIVGRFLCLFVCLFFVEFCKKKKTTVAAPPVVIYLTEYLSVASSTYWKISK